MRARNASTTESIGHSDWTYMCGGFSPPCVARIKRFGRKARASGDRTRYPTRRSRRQLSYVQFHTQRISSAIVKGEAKGIMTQLTRFRVAPQAAA